MPRRRTLLVAGVVVLLAGLGGAAYAVLGGGRYDDTLRHYSNAAGKAQRFVNLPDGRAQLAIGSPDSHRIVVQWRDPDGKGWTAPETVWTASKRLTAIDDTLRYGGGTVAVRQIFTPDTSDEGGVGNVEVGIVCRDLRCTARKVPEGGGGAPQVTPDGRTVVLGERRSGVAMWTDAGGIRDRRWSGHPGDELEVRATAPALLAPEGSLRVVSARSSTGSCTFELFVSGRRSTSLTRAASVTEPLRGRSESECRTYLDTLSSDWVSTHPTDHRAANFWFIRRGRAWTTTRDDPSGIVIVDAGDGCCSTGVQSFVHWNQVSFASRDSGRHLVLQTQFLGRETWERPVQVDGVPAGYDCDDIGGDLQSIGRSGAFVTLTCRRAGTFEKPVGPVHVVAASPDLRRWTSRVVPDDGSEPHVDGDTLTIGRTTWSPTAGFGTR